VHCVNISLSAATSGGLRLIYCRHTRVTLRYGRYGPANCTRADNAATGDTRTRSARDRIRVHARDAQSSEARRGTASARALFFPGRRTRNDS
jgi:hypothetical protein